MYCLLPAFIADRQQPMLESSLRRRHQRLERWERQDPHRGQEDDAGLWAVWITLGETGCGLASSSAIEGFTRETRRTDASSGGGPDAPDLMPDWLAVDSTVRYQP